MRAALQQYLEGFNTRDADKVLSLFADDAVVEDPFGTPPMNGRDAFTTFFTDAVTGGVELTLDSPIRTSHGAAAAMAFTITAGTLTIKAVDVMHFDDDGKVIKMQAFWGPTDMTTA